MQHGIDGPEPAFIAVLYILRYTKGAQADALFRAPPSLHRSFLFGTSHLQATNVARVSREMQIHGTMFTSTLEKSCTLA